MSLVGVRCSRMIYRVYSLGEVYLEGSLLADFILFLYIYAITLSSNCFMSNSLVGVTTYVYDRLSLIDFLAMTRLFL